MRKADRTLKTILSLIEQDIRAIKKRANGNPFDKETSSALSRYAKLLTDVREENDKEKEKEKKKLERLSTTELVQMYVENKKKKETVSK